MRSIKNIILNEYQKELLYYQTLFSYLKAQLDFIGMNLPFHSFQYLLIIFPTQRFTF